MAPQHCIVIPGDDPLQIADSPRLDALREVAEVQLYRDRPASPEEQLRRVEPATVIINSRGAVKWPGELLRQLPGLQMIVVCGIGTDSIDLAAARECGIAVCNIPGRTAPVVAEHALALLMATARRLAWFTARMKAGHWDRRLSDSLAGRTVGVVGTGNIGTEMIRLCRAIGMNVVAWSFHPDQQKAEQLGFRYVELPELLATSDAISLHVRLSDETRGLIGRQELLQMQPGTLLINTARAAVVETAALVDLLNAGHLGGAGIDVFDQEPLPAGHPLLECEQVVLTPHSADQTPEGVDRLNAGCVENTLKWIAGQPQNRVV
ncbi:MAG: 3-phosphoglycerate dehydrogenase [Planctomycetaceae bacterium]|nr:3-phosphoglycerate dehydrogenase [Planctomycetaceae bacterium]